MGIHSRELIVPHQQSTEGVRMHAKSGITAVVPCRHCDTMISAIAEICPHCGVRQLPTDVGQPLDASDKRIVPAVLLCLLLGVFGAHRFYVRKTDRKSTRLNSSHPVNSYGVSR